MLPLGFSLKVQIFCGLGGESSRALREAGLEGWGTFRSPVERGIQAQDRDLLSPLIIAMITGVCFTSRHEGT